MRIIVCENYEDMSKKAAAIVAGQVALKPNSVLGLATGSTPIGLYNGLVEKYENGEIDFADITSVNLDEYYPLSPENDQSYRYFMNKNLFDRINIDKSRTFVPNGLAEDAEAECKAYEERIDALGGIDLQVLGIGPNGHIGFNEPDDTLCAVTHLTGLTDSTIEANARFFESKADVPTKALTMGMGSIMKAKTIVVLANGKAKKDAVKALMDDVITPQVPVTLLKAHPNTILLCDKEAFGE